MKKIFKFWYITVFLILTALIYQQQRTFLSTRSYQEYLFSKPIYAHWPTWNLVEDPSLKGASFPSAVVMYRGNPERQGWIRGMIAPKYDVAWTFPYFNSGAHSAAKGSAVADEDGIYIGSDIGWLYHFGWDGKIKWKIFNELALKGIHGTPVLDGDYLFYGDYAGYLQAVNKKTGQLLWTRHLGDTLGASPLVLGDYIYANVELNPAGGFIVKIKKTDGSLIYKSSMLGEQSHSSPAYDLNTKTLVFGANDDLLYGMDLETGEIRWRIKSPGKIKSTPVLVNGKSYHTDWGKGLYGTDIQKIQNLFAAPLKTMAINSPALVRDKIVVADRENLYLFTLDGQKIKDMSLNNKLYFGSPLVVQDGAKEIILVGCENETSLCAINDSLSQKRILYRGTKRISTVPFVFKDRIVFAQDDGDLIVLKKSQ